MGLEENLEYAKKAIAYVRSLLKNGSNRRDDTPNGTEFASQTINTLRKEVEVAKKGLPLVTRNRPHALLGFALSAMAMTKYQYGHCGEQADAAYLYLWLLGVFPLDLYEVGDHQHELVVIGRDRYSDPTKPKTWGKNAVICDPHAEKFYPAFQLPTMQQQKNNVLLADFSLPHPHVHYLLGDFKSLHRDEKVVGVYHSAPHPHLIVPVLSSTYRTINFNTNPTQVLYSSVVSACIVMVIRNNNIATMAHFYPNNAYDEKTCLNNYKIAQQDFMNSGGQFNKDVQITLYGGGQKIGEDYWQGPLSTLEDALKDAKIKHTIIQKAKFQATQGNIIVFMHKAGTQVVMNKRVWDNTYHSYLLNPASSNDIKIEVLAGIHNCLPRDYHELNKKWIDKVSELPTECYQNGDYVYNAIPLFDMEMIIEKPWEEILSKIPKNAQKYKNVV